MRFGPVLLGVLIFGSTNWGKAQLNGEFTFDIAAIFGKSPYCFEDSDLEYLSLYPNPSANYIYFPTGTASHHPRTGQFAITGNSSFTREYSFPGIDSQVEKYYVFPSDFNASLAEDDWELTSAPVRIVGRTYTDKRTRTALFDISSGSIQLVGSYLQWSPAANTWNRFTIRKGFLAFKGNRFASAAAYEGDGASIRITGSAPLSNKQIKRFNSNGRIYAFEWGGGRYAVDTDSYEELATFYLDLNVTTSGTSINGTAEAYFYYFYNSKISADSVEDYYPEETPSSKWWRYSVKGTSKNGIAILSLSGLGIIKGLTATLHINEATRQIVQNGKNSITLYGQTILY